MTLDEESPNRWASLADRLNPNRSAFDPKFKEEWKTLSKGEKKKIIAEDRRKIHELQNRAKPLPFPTDDSDHCETSKTAYQHIAPFLELLARRKNKLPADLLIFDPYYCAGTMVHHLKELGFTSVHNRPDDFYETINKKKIPPHDVLITNPPYSDNHFERLKAFLKSNKNPNFLLVPDHFKVDAKDYTFLKPIERYHYWTPSGLRPEEDSKKKKHRNLMLGSRNSPFPSKWCISLEPVIPVKELHQSKILRNLKGCKFYGEDTTFLHNGVRFRQKASSNAESDDEPKQKRRRKV